MDNFVQRFRNKDILPSQLSVPLSVGDDTFVLKVARFAQEEMNFARKVADKEARERGAKPSELDDMESLQLYALALAPIVFRHIKNWEHKSAQGEIPFSIETASALLAEMNHTELVAVGLGYVVALAEAHKKKENTATSATPNA